MGKLGFTPLIGLAVVVALALAAVFGAMSLTPNPAYAQSTAPVLTATGGVSSVDLSWTWEYTLPSGTTLANWQYRQKEDGSSFGAWANIPNASATPGTRSDTIPALEVDIAYTFQVRAVLNIDGTVTPQPRSNEASATPGAAPGGTIGTLMAEGGAGTVKLSWTWDPFDNTPAATSWQYQQAATGWKDLSDVTPDGNKREATVKDLAMATDVMFMVRPVSARGVAGSASTPSANTSIEVGPNFEAGSKKPGSNTRYDISFVVTLDGTATPPETLNTVTDDIVVELEDYNVPSSIGETSIALSLTSTTGCPDAQGGGESTACNYTTIADSVAVSGEKIAITVGDWNKDRTGSNTAAYRNVPNGATVTVVLKQSAGIRNPSKAGKYGPAIEVKATNNPSNKLVEVDMTDEHEIQRIVKLSEEDGGLGDEVTATASGFEKNVTVHFFLDGYAGRTPNGELDQGEDILCSAKSSGDNVASCEFTVATPTFKRNFNYVNAVDGDGNTGTHTMDDDQRFELKPSISASPAGGSPGEIMQVQLVSFPISGMISRITLSGDDICGGDAAACQYGNVGGQGTASIPVTVPNWAVGGVQELKVWAGGEDDTFNVTIVGPRIIPTPSTVVANQRVSLVGTGFSPRAKIGDVDVTVSDPVKPEISIGGAPIGWSKVNDGRVVLVDDGGNWAASVDLPLVEATTGSGDRTIRITDSKGRTGSIDVTLAERSFDITPASGRVGTQAVVRGMGYPSKNDEGHSFTVDVIYKVQEGATARVSVVPDASGRFEVQLRIPTTASIPSTNQVEVSFDHEMGGTGVLENKQHFVPEGIIKLSATSGGSRDHGYRER